jgi:ubiquinone/menaquinone biosynthesis C-methylase UbiE
MGENSKRNPSEERYVAALGWRALNRLYDPALRLTMPERRLRDLLLRQANVRKGHTVLDIGSGTGTLLIMLAERVSRARLVGVDGDLGMLHLARAKADKAGATLAWTAGLAFSLPFCSMAVDRVLTTLVLHHLSTHNKHRALSEMFRVLRPGGEVHIADWGKPHTALMHVASVSLKVFETAGGTTANLQGRLPEFCAAAGFCGVTETGHISTMFGTITLLSARRP